MATPREHIEKIKKQLSDELYSKDVRFLMNLIQNAEDNDYAPDVQPSLELVFTTEDVAGVGAPATLLVFNNEKGFQKQNIDSICSVGRSTKTNDRGDGYIGEKGIGFKSVFLVTSQPCIFSNGYKIRFNEIPPSDVNIGYIIPEWIEDKSCIAQLKEIYGCQLPNTVIVLPLRPEKVEAVKQQLSSIHPEVLLFLSKIKKLSVRELKHGDLNRTYKISVFRENYIRSSVTNDIESFVLHLVAEEDQFLTRQCSYYMWRQWFPVENEYWVEQRKDVAKWSITLAFPLGKRFTGENMIAAGIYALHPTEMVTGFPFIIQADFLLVSSRERIIFNNNWNQGILHCIPLAFCSAFRALISAKSPLSSKVGVFGYLPHDIPCYPQLTQVRDAIQAQLKAEDVILCDVSFGGKLLCKPTEARTILPAFKHILERASKQGQRSEQAHLFCRNVHIVHPSLDKEEFHNSLNFLGVVHVSYNWYAPCIRSSGWLQGLPEDLYVELLCFIAENWEGLSSHLQDAPLLKYISSSKTTDLASVLDATGQTRIYLSSKESHISWLTKWSGELASAVEYYLMPESTQKAITNLDPKESKKLCEWLKQHPEITELSTLKFAEQLLDAVSKSKDSQLAITTAYFLHCSYTNNKISYKQLVSLCKNIPLVVEDGYLIRERRSRKFLVPASTGNWAKLMGNNPWTLDFETLSEDYLKLPPCAEDLIYSGNDLVSEDSIMLPPCGRGSMYSDIDLVTFFRRDLDVVDIPELFPPNAKLPAVSHSLTKENAFLLLEWIRYLKRKRKLPDAFLRSISEGRWLATSRGFESPARSFLFDSKGKSSPLQYDDIPFIDEDYYGETIHEFKDTLKKVGVVTEFGKGCDIIVGHHIRKHKDFNAIKRLYKYLQASKWKPRESKVLIIWIPNDGWHDASSCVVHDVDGIFKSRLKVLEGWYDEPSLLDFFSKSLGVPRHPRMEDYCSLWREWVANSRHRIILESECCLVWKHIVQNWSCSSFRIRQYLKTDGVCKVPVCTDNGDIRVCIKDKAFVPDDLQLKELFKEYSGRLNFTWQPNPCNPEIPLEVLFSIYNNLGVKNLSQAVRRIEISAPDNMMPWEKLTPGEGLLGMGLYKILIAYLANPAFKIPANKRHQLVKGLLDCPVYGVREPLVMQYSLLLARETGEAENIQVNTTRMVRWEKEKKRLLVQTPDPHNKKETMLFATTFAEVVSDGLLVEFPDLVAGLCEIIKDGCFVNFNLEAVDVMLQGMNFQLFMEDERFLSSLFLKKEVSGSESSTSARWVGDAIAYRKRKGEGRGRAISNDYEAGKVFSIQRQKVV